MKRVRGAQPTSPGDGRSKTLISHDLLLLQALTHAHNMKQSEK